MCRQAVEWYGALFVQGHINQCAVSFKKSGYDVVLWHLLKDGENMLLLFCLPEICQENTV